MKSSIWECRPYISFDGWENKSSLRLSDLLQVRQLIIVSLEPRSLDTDWRAFFWCNTFGSLDKHSHSERGRQQPALKDTSNPGIRCWKLHLKKMWELGSLTSLWLMLPKDSWVGAGCVQQLLTLCHSPIKETDLQSVIYSIHLSCNFTSIWRSLFWFVSMELAQKSSRLLYVNYSFWKLRESLKAIIHLL